LKNFITHPVFFPSNQTRTQLESNKLRFFHDVKFFLRKFRLYHSFDLMQQKNSFHTAEFPKFNNSLPNYRLFFQNAFFDTTNTRYTILYRKIENEVGFNFKNKYFYLNAYYTNVNIGFKEIENQDTKTDSTKANYPKFNSGYVGFTSKFFVSKNLALNIESKKQIYFYSLNSQGNLFDTIFYNRNEFENILRFQHSNLFELSYISKKISPNLLQSYIRSNHFIWNNNFKAQHFQIFSADGNLIHSNLLSFSCNLSYELIKDFIYLDNNCIPIQSNKLLSILKIGISQSLHLWKIFIENSFTYANTNNNIIRVPTYNWVNKTYFESNLFNKTLLLEFGVLVNYQSKYLGLAYMPALQSFYLQDYFLIQGYPNISPFILGKLKNAALWARMVHFNQLFYNGYFESPNYPALRTTFIFGIKWEFFN
jgi:hypothetical protein